MIGGHLNYTAFYTSLTDTIGGSRKKGRLGRYRRMAGAPGRGTLEKDKPPILGLIQRGGQVVLHMLANVRQKTIEPIITGAVARAP